MSRRRSRSSNFEGSLTVYYKSTGKTSVTNSGGFEFYEECQDHTGNFPKKNPLLIWRHDRTNFCRISGVVEDSISKRTYLDFKPSVSLSLLETLMPSYPYTKDMNRVLAQSGPLTPKVNIPLFVYELKDLPSMLKHAGDLLLGLRRRPAKTLLSPREAASSTLAFQFGWKPIIDDLSKMIKFSELVQKRQRELKRANSRNGLRRRITLDDSGDSLTVKRGIGDYVGNVTWNIDRTRKCWAVVRWNLRDVGSIGTEPSFIDAFKSALGLSRGHVPVTVWKALPWSWFIDWFADISNILTANYNMLYYKPTSVCFMQTRTATAANPEKITRVVLSAGITKHHQKERSVVTNPTTSLSMKLPFIDNFKLSILGSLSVLAVMRRHRS